MFNSLKHAKKLEEAGVPREQAEAQVLVISEILEMNLATKENLLSTQNAMKSDFDAFRAEIRHEMRELEQRMTIKLGAIVSIALTVAVALAKLIH